VPAVTTDIASNLLLTMLGSDELPKDHMLLILQLLLTNQKDIINYILKCNLL